MYDLRHTISTFSTVYNMYHLSQPDNSTLKNIGYIAITIYICLRMRQKKTITTNRFILLSRKRMHIKPRWLYLTTKHVLIVETFRSDRVDCKCGLHVHTQSCHTYWYNVQILQDYRKNPVWWMSMCYQF